MPHTKHLLLVLMLFASALCMAADAIPMPYTKVQFLDNDGNPCNGCKLYTYAASTSTPLATYSDTGGVTQNTNPVVLDAAGRASVNLGNNSYKLVLKSADTANTYWTQDNINNYLLLSRANTWSGANIFNGAVTFNGTITGNGTVTAKTVNLKVLNSVRYADQFSGADCGAKINAADADIGATPGEIWVNQACGTSWSTGVSISAGHVLRFIQGGTFTSSAAPMINLAGQGSAVDCGNYAATTLASSNATGDIVQTNGAFWGVSNCAFKSAVAKSGGAGLRVKSGNGHAENLRFDTTHVAIQAIDSGAFGHFVNIRIGAGLSTTGGAWTCGIEIGGIASGTVTGNQFEGLHINQQLGFTDASICLYDGADATLFTNFDIGQFTGSVARAVHVGRKAGGQIPEWTRFNTGHLEADSTSTNVLIEEARDIQFTNVAIQNGLNGVWFKTTCIACRIVGGEMLQFQQEAIKIDASTGIEIADLAIGDAGQATDNTYDTIHVAANLGSFILDNITFQNITASVPTNTARYSVYIEAGTSNFYYLTNLFIGQSHSKLFDGGTGTSKFIYGINDASTPSYFWTGFRSIISNTYSTQSNCNSAASPAVCGSSASGSVVIAAASTNVVVNTTAVTANSQILLQQDDSLGARLGVTCNTNWFNVAISGRTAGTGFVIVSDAVPAADPLCLSYTIIN